MNLLISNLAVDTTADELRETFEAFGEVSSARLFGPLGYGVVDMPDTLEADAARRALHLHVLRGRALLVRENRWPGPRPPTRTYGRMN